MFDAVEVKRLVDDFSLWKGDSYRLAILVAELAAAHEKSQNIAILEAADMNEAADLLRA